MAGLEEIRVPDLGDVDEVDVVEVLVSAGDRVAKDDPLITLESDKATMDVPAPLAGTVRELKVKAGDKVGDGALILTLEVAAAEAEAGAEAAAAESKEPEATTPEEAATAPPEGEPAPPAAAPEPSPAAAAPAPTPAPEPAPVPAPTDEAGFAKAYASPAVRRYARELGVDLSRVRGSGRKNRILKEDVQAWVKKTLAEPRAEGAAFGLPPMPVIDFSKFGPTERQPLTRIQKIAGPHLHRSWVRVPHVTQHDEADVTDLEAFRQAHSAEAKAEGFSLTPLVFVMKAAVAALAEFPGVNSSLDAEGEHLVLKRYYHLGIAVDTPGGLVVPVVRDVDKKGLFELARELAETSARAREGKLKPDDLRGASFTISSLGGIGGTAFTPIVNAPEVAILGVSRSQMRPVWNGSEFEPRLMLPLSLSYDHRVIDGAQAVRFTTYLAKVLADIRRLLL